MPPTKTYGSLNPLLNIPVKPKATPTSSVPVTQPTQPTYKPPVKTAQSIVSNPYDALMTQAKNIQAQIPTATNLTTPATAYGADLRNYSANSASDVEIANQLKNTYKTQDENPERVFRDKLKQYQQEIDAVNQIYRQQINVENTAGQGRLGSGRAIQARSGLLGSDFASSQNDAIGSYNQDQVSSIQAEQAAKVQSIMGLARKDAADEIKARREANAAGGASRLAFLNEQDTRRGNKLQEFIASIGDTDISKVNPTNLAEVAKSYGVSVETLKAKVKEAKATADASAKETDLKNRKGEADIAKINADIASGKLITMSEGNKLYNTETGEVVAYNPKTYAPKDTEGSAIVPLGGSSPFVAQTNYGKLNAKQKTQADSLNNLVRSLNDYKTTYDSNPGAFGGKAGNLVGADAGLLETKLNSIIFAAAQAEGTGALQAADRQVIEKIIPNPTSISGAFNTLTKGGKQGNITRIEDQINKYTSNLAGYGLAPVAEDSNSQNKSPASNTDQPKQMTLPNGTVLTLQPDGTYE